MLGAMSKEFLDFALNSFEERNGTATLGMYPKIEKKPDGTFRIDKGSMRLPGGVTQGQLEKAQHYKNHFDNWVAQNQSSENLDPNKYPRRKYLEWANGIFSQIEEATPKSVDQSATSQFDDDNLVVSDNIKTELPTRIGINANQHDLIYQKLISDYGMNGDEANHYISQHYEVANMGPDDEVHR